MDCYMHLLTYLCKVSYTDSPTNHIPGAHLQFSKADEPTGHKPGSRLPLRHNVSLALQNRSNQLSCHLGGEWGGPKEPCIRWPCALLSPGKYG